MSRVRGTTKGKSSPARPVSMPTQASGGSPTSTRKLAEGKGAASAGNIGAEEIYEPMEMEPAHKLKSGSKTALLPLHLEIAEEGEEGEVAGEGEGDGEGEEEAEMFEEDDDDFDEWSEVDEEEGDVDPGQSSISRTRSINSTSGGSKRGMYNELRMALTNRINSIDDLGRSGTLRRPGPATAGGLAADAPQAAVTGPVPAAAGAAGAADACRPAKLWSELPKVQASGLLRTLDKKAIKRQEAIYELVYSEEAFLADVQVLLEVYLLPMEAHARNAEFHGGKSLMKRDVVRVGFLFWRRVCLLMNLLCQFIRSSLPYPNSDCWRAHKASRWPRGTLCGRCRAVATTRLRWSTFPMFWTRAWPTCARRFTPTTTSVSRPSPMSTIRRPSLSSFSSAAPQTRAPRCCPCTFTCWCRCSASRATPCLSTLVLGGGGMWRNSCFWGKRR